MMEPDMHADFYDQLIKLAGLRTAPGQKEEAFRAGVTAGYTKEITQINSEEVDKNESIYTDGLMVGLGINNEEEYNQIIKESEERQKLSLKDLRKDLKTFNFGVMYGMTPHSMKDMIVDYAKVDADITTKLVEALAGKEESNA